LCRFGGYSDLRGGGKEARDVPKGGEIQKKPKKRRWGEREKDTLRVLVRFSKLSCTIVGPLDWEAESPIFGVCWGGDGVSEGGKGLMEEKMKGGCL